MAGGKALMFSVYLIFIEPPESKDAKEIDIR